MRRQSQKQLLLKCYAKICKKGRVRVTSPAGNTDTVIITARKEEIPAQRPCQLYGVIRSSHICSSTVKMGAI